MLDALDKIEQFNDARGLIAKGFSPVMENSFLLSEELETLEWEVMLPGLARKVDNHDKAAAELVRLFGKHNAPTLEAKVEYVDKVLDHFFFGGDGMLKMGLTKELILKCLHAVCDANLAKGSTTVDGKVTKDDSFEAIDPKHVIRKVLMEIENGE